MSYTLPRAATLVRFAATATAVISSNPDLRDTDLAGVDDVRTDFCLITINANQEVQVEIDEGTTIFLWFAGAGAVQLFLEYSPEIEPV